MGEYRISDQLAVLTSRILDPPLKLRIEYQGDQGVRVPVAVQVMGNSIILH